MMTLSQIERLVRKIAEAASHPSSDTQTAKMAQDYAELCRAANRRLEQCALMIEAGQFLQALQLAETAPPLMDLITLLTFRQSAEWRAYCQAHQLPWPEPFYDKSIRLLNEAYGKGITSDHPFYKDYRRAVMENDDARAFSILRVISRLNPADANTQAELKRLEEKLLRVRLEGLREIVAAGDAANIQAGLEQLESSGLPVPASHPVWQQAQVTRCQQTLRRAEGLREKDLWQEVETLVEDIHSFATRYDVRLPDADADTWSSLEEWSGEKRAAYAAEQDFRRAISALEYETDSLTAKRASGAQLNEVEATKALNTLTEKRREAERFGKPLDEELVAKHQKGSDWLRQQIQAANRRKQILTVVTVLVILGAIGAAIPSILTKSKQVTYGRQLEQLEAARKVSEVESVLVEAPPLWKANPKMAESLAKAKDFLTREKELMQTFDQTLIGLQQSAANGFHGALAQIAPTRASSGQALRQLAPEYQPTAKSALDAWDSQWQKFRNAELGDILKRAEEAAEVINTTNGTASGRAAVSQIQTILSGTGPLVAQPPELAPELGVRLSGLSNKIENWTTLAEKWEKVQAALVRAESVDEYLEALDHLSLSPFATAAQKSAVEKVDLFHLNQEMLLGQLLLPNDPTNWHTLTNVADWNTALMPLLPTSQEKDIYFKLRDDKNVRDVYAYELITNTRPNNPFRTHPVFVQGTIALDAGGQEAGMVDDPAQYRDSLHFAHTAYSDWDYIKIQRLYRTLECDCYERLGLGELIDANTGNYQKQILQIFDQLNQENKASAVFRAFVTLKLLAVAQLRPADWGFTWCPSLTAHMDALTALDAKEIQSGDWMVPERSAKWERPLQDYFNKARAIPLAKQAQFLQQLVHDTCAKGFIFAGFADASGQPVLRSLPSPTAEVCGWSRAGAAALLWRKAPTGDTYTPVTEALPYSPLFVFAGDRRELLLETLKATAYPRSLAEAILPPFFGGAL